MAFQSVFWSSALFSNYKILYKFILCKIKIFSFKRSPSLHFGMRISANVKSRRIKLALKCLKIYMYFQKNNAILKFWSTLFFRIKIHHSDILSSLSISPTSFSSGVTFTVPNKNFENLKMRYIQCLLHRKNSRFGLSGRYPGAFFEKVDGILPRLNS